MTLRTLLSALLMGILLFSVSPTSHAEPSNAPTCTNTVVDETTDHLFDVDRLTAAARGMGNRTGLDVYVRAFQTTPHGDAGVWWREAYKSCPAWLFTDGVTPKPNILVVAVGMDRKSAIEYGESVTKLDGAVDSIRGKVLGDALRDANAAPDSEKREAFTAAIEKTLAELEAEYTKPPFNWGTVWSWVLKVLLSVAGVAASVFGFFVSRTGIRKHREKAKLRAEVKEARDASTSAVVNAEAALRAHFIEADSALEGVEGEYIALPSRESITERINVASAAHFERSGDPAPKSVEDLVAARNAYRGYAEDIARALSDAEKRTQGIRARAEQCTDEAKDRDLRQASSKGGVALRELNDKAPGWLDTTTDAAILSVAIKTADTLVGASAPRPTVDMALDGVQRACVGADSTMAGARSAGKAMESLRSDATKALTAYTSTPPADVSERTVASTKAALEKLAPKIVATAEELRARQTPLDIAVVNTQVSAFRAELDSVLDAARTEIAAAERKRAEEKRNREEEQRRRDEEARRRRREEEERTRATSYGTGFGMGYGSGGGFSSGGGGGFGGGSSGSW